MKLSRPTVSVYSVTGEPIDEVSLATILTSPIRPDIISMVHSNINKNRRQPYAVTPKAGHQTAAKSWGTGRAVARIPRVPGTGSHRSGQGAIGNMCRGGHMYAPTKNWRKWHCKVNINTARYAVASALASSTVPALVIARGHRIEHIPEIPLVVENAMESISTTHNAISCIKSLGAGLESNRTASSRQIRKGRGKLRNRRHIVKKGPMIIHGTKHGIARSLRNLPGVDNACVESLNLLKLAPGGHLGRFLIWTKSAMEKLNANFCPDEISRKANGYVLPRACLSNPELTRVLNSDEVQSSMNAPLAVGSQKKNHFHLTRKNPLAKKKALICLNPHAFIEKAPLKKEIGGSSKLAKKLFYHELVNYSDREQKGIVHDFHTWLGLSSSN